MAKNTASKNIRRRQKINAIFNATFDDQLAQRYRDASWQRIEKEFGVLKPEGQTIPDKQTAPKEIKEYLKRTESYRQHLDKVELNGNYKIPKKYSGKTRREREEVWSEFSSKDKQTKQYIMPDSLDKLASNINLSNGLDPNSSYGYAAVYYSFTQDLDIATVLKDMNIINKELDVYTYEKKV